ncbi:MAG: magnesium and cobalt transport protein CorA, partial [Terriglobia bacterium]
MRDVTTSTQNLTGVRKAAVLLISLGDKAASEILRRMTPADVQRITAEIANVQFVSQEASSKIIEEFDKLVSAQEVLAAGGADYAGKLLASAFGEVEAKR